MTVHLLGLRLMLGSGLRNFFSRLGRVISVHRRPITRTPNGYRIGVRHAKQ